MSLEGIIQDTLQHFQQTTSVIRAIKDCTKHIFSKNKKRLQVSRIVSLYPNVLNSSEHKVKANTSLEILDIEDEDYKNHYFGFGYLKK